MILFSLCLVALSFSCLIIAKNIICGERKVKADVSPKLTALSIKIKAKDHQLKNADCGMLVAKLNKQREVYISEMISVIEGVHIADDQKQTGEIINFPSPRKEVERF